MSHDVYICYDEQDKLASDAIGHVLEENNIKCWVKSRDFSSTDSVDKISQVIRSSKCVVLVYSKSAKKSNRVITEIDIAFSSGISIVVYNIDDSNKKGDLEFFLKNKHWLSAFPNPTQQFESLIRQTSKILGNPIEKPIVSPKDTRSMKRIKPQSGKINLKKYIKIAIPIVIILILIYCFVIFPMGRNTTDDGVFSMKITDVDVNEVNGEFLYTVHGESFNLPENAKEYIMRINYYDKNNNEVYSQNATADEFKSGIISQISIPQNNVTAITFKLEDSHGKVISEDSFKMG